MQEEVNDLCLCTMALNARPSLQLVVKLWMLTLGYLQRPDQKSLIINSTKQNSSVSASVNTGIAQQDEHIFNILIVLVLSRSFLTQQFSFGTKAAEHL